MMNGFILQENTSIDVEEMVKTLYSILQESGLDSLMFSIILIIHNAFKKQYLNYCLT